MFPTSEEKLTFSRIFDVFLILSGPGGAESPGNYQKWIPREILHFLACRNVPKLLLSFEIDQNIWKSIRNPLLCTIGTLTGLLYQKAKFSTMILDHQNLGAEAKYQKSLTPSLEALLVSLKNGRTSPRSCGARRSIQSLWGEKLTFFQVDF